VLTDPLISNIVGTDSRRSTVVRWTSVDHRHQLFRGAGRSTSYSATQITPPRPPETFTMLIVDYRVKNRAEPGFSSRHLGRPHSSINGTPPLHIDDIEPRAHHTGSDCYQPGGHHRLELRPEALRLLRDPRLTPAAPRIHDANAPKLCPLNIINQSTTVGDGELPRLPPPVVPWPLA
jgi:hypothetical protein